MADYRLIFSHKSILLRAYLRACLKFAEYNLPSFYCLCPFLYFTITASGKPFVRQ